MSNWYDVSRMGVKFVDKAPLAETQESELLTQNTLRIMTGLNKLSSEIYGHINACILAPDADIKSAEDRESYYATLPGMSNFISASSSRRAKAAPKPESASLIKYWDNDLVECARLINLMRVGFNNEYLDEPEICVVMAQKYLNTARNTPQDTGIAHYDALEYSAKELARASSLLKLHLALVSNDWEKEIQGSSESRPSFKRGN